MLKKDRAIFAHKVLQRLYKTTPIPLDHTDNYTLLVAVLLSAQCTDIRVNQVTPALFKLASTAMPPLDLSSFRVPYRFCHAGSERAIGEIERQVLKRTATLVVLSTFTRNKASKMEEIVIISSKST